MSAIDTYKHKLLGFIKCESDYDFVLNSGTRDIALYKLEENIPESEYDFDGHLNDKLVGGGSGEAPTFGISYPNVFKFFDGSEFDNFKRLS